MRRHAALRLVASSAARTRGQRRGQNDRGDQRGKRGRQPRRSVSVQVSSPRLAARVDALLLDGLKKRYHTIRSTMGRGGVAPHKSARGVSVKVLAVLIMIMGLVIIIVPQFTNCESGKDHPATINMQSGVAGAVEYASMGGMSTSASESTSVPYRMMKCFWSARAEIVAGVPLIALGILLFFARRKETIRVIGILTVLLGVLTVVIPTQLVGTCANTAMVCNTEMKPALLVAGGITVALGVAVLVLGEMRRPSGGAEIADAA